MVRRIIQPRVVCQEHDFILLRYPRRSYLEVPACSWIWQTQCHCPGRSPVAAHSCYSPRSWSSPSTATRTQASGTPGPQQEAVGKEELLERVNTGTSVAAYLVHYNRRPFCSMLFVFSSFRNCLTRCFQRENKICPFSILYGHVNCWCFVHFCTIMGW